MYIYIYRVFLKEWCNKELEYRLNGTRYLNFVKSIRCRIFLSFFYVYLVYSYVLPIIYNVKKNPTLQFLVPRQNRRRDDFEQNTIFYRTQNL